MVATARIAAARVTPLLRADGCVWRARRLDAYIIQGVTVASSPQNASSL